MKNYITHRLIFGLILSAGLFFILLVGMHREARPAASPQYAQGIRLPIIMYHGLLKDVTLSGDYVVTPSLLEADLNWLLEQGYTPVLIGDVISYIKGEGALPPKPVAITFDDGLINNALYLLPLLDKYDFCATLAVVGEYAQLYTDNPDPSPSYGYLTWEEVAELAAHPKIEIINHSNAFHHHHPTPEEDQRAQYAALQAEDAVTMNNLLRQKAGVTTTVYAYPFGAQTEGTDDLLRAQGFECTLMCREEVNTILQGDSDCLFSMGRYNRPAGVSTEDFMAYVLDGKAYKK